LGCEVWVKHENHTAVGAFKIRGGIFYLSEMKRANDKLKGLVAATRGNHGQSLAFAAKLYDLKAVIVVPHRNSKEKNSAMRALGAELIVHGNDFQEALEHAAQLAEEQELLPVPSFDPLLVQGVASYALELFNGMPEPDVVYVPIGMGSGICGVMAARDALKMKTAVVGVVSKGAPAFVLSYRARHLISHTVTTQICDGLACRTPDARAVDWIRNGVDRIVEVDDSEVEAAMRIHFSDTHNVSEGAGAAALAGAMQERGMLKGKRIALVLSGGNVDRDIFARILNADGRMPTTRVPA